MDWQEVHFLTIGRSNAGNDDAAKATVTKLQDFGWQDVIDLGDISAARNMEMLLPSWVRLWGALKTPMFGFRVVRESNREGHERPGIDASTPSI